jgi:hypothetical protein
MFREFLHSLLECNSYPLGSVTVWEWEQHHITGVAIDQGSDRCLAFAHHQVALPMARHSLVSYLGWPVGDHDGVNSLAFS